LIVLLMLRLPQQCARLLPYLRVNLVRLQLLPPYSQRLRLAAVEKAAVACRKLRIIARG
jgi:hypothetical protein